MDLINQLLTRIDLLILVLVRMTGLFVVAPIFGARNLPNYIKIGLAAISSFILVSTLKPIDLNYYNSVMVYGVLVFKEFMIGILIGFVAYLIFTAILMAGEIIDMQIGFGVVNIMDPMSNVQLPVTGNLYYILTLLIFLMADGHHALITGLFRSYEILPIGAAVFNSSIVDTMTKLLAEIFIIGFKIAAPIVLSIMVTDIGLGILTKSLPQLNIYIVGMPLKILLGILIMVITVPAFVGIVDVLKQGAYSDTINVIKEMSPK